MKRQLLIAASLIALATPGLSAQPIDKDTFVESTWQSEGCILEVEIAGQDLFELTLTYRADGDRHPLRKFVRNIPDIELKTASRTRDALETESYLLSYPIPSIDGDPRIMPDFVGRMVKYGFTAVVDEIGAPKIYTESDFQGQDSLANSSSVRRLLDRFDGDALAYLRDLFIRARFVERVFADYEGIAVPTMHLRPDLGYELGLDGKCIEVVGLCDDYNPLTLVRTLGNQKLSTLETAPQDALLTFLATSHERAKK